MGVDGIGDGMQLVVTMIGLTPRGTTHWLQWLQWNVAECRQKG